MTLEKILKNFGRGVLGTILATSLFFSCDTGTTTTNRYDEDEETIITTGEIQGRVVYPTVENNSWIWKGKKDATILIDGKSAGKSVADGIFYITGIKAGACNLKVSYNKLYLSEEIGVPVYSEKLTTINKDIEMIPIEDTCEIVYGIIYTDSNKKSRYTGQVRITNNHQQKSYITNGVYAFQGSVDGKEMMADIKPGVSAKRIKFFDRQNNESLQIDLKDSWIVEQNGYVSE